MGRSSGLRRAGRLAFLSGLVLSLVACSSGSSGTPDNDVSTGPEVTEDAGTTDVVIPDWDVVIPTDAGDSQGGAADLPDVTACSSPYVSLPVAFGLLTSYSRAHNYASVRGWSDQARSAGYKGLVFTDRVNLAADAGALDALSDLTPDDALLEIAHFDASYEDFESEGDGAWAGTLDASEEPDLVEAPGLGLESVADGFARAGYESLTGFDFDRQDTRLRLRLRVPQKASPSRVLLSMGFGQKLNQKELRWVLSWAGDPGDGDMAGDGLQADWNATAQFYDYDLLLRDQIRTSVDEYVWQEGALWRLDFLAEGAAHAVFDEIRLASDAFYDGLRRESADYSDTRVALVPGVEFELDDGHHLYCVGAGSFPTLDGRDAAAVHSALDAGECWRVVDVATAQADDGDFDAVVLWEPDGGDNVDESTWDALLTAHGPFTALAADRPKRARDLDDTLLHNHVLATSVDADDLMEALQAGRSTMTSHQDLTAEFWFAGPDCDMIGIGDTLTSDAPLHVRVSCPGGVDSVELVQVDALGSATRVPVTGAALGAEIDTSGFGDGYVRLVALCAAGERLYTNPIWIDRE